VLARLGVTQAVEYLRSLGFHSLKQSGTYYGLGLALGSAEVTLEELVGAYAILARDGSPLTFRWSRAAVDSLGRPLQPGKRLKALFRATNRTPQLSPSVARVLKHMLSDPAARLPSFQRHGWLEFPFPVAVKTGTSQGHRDAWMVAVSDRVVVGCWVGNHNRRKMVGVYGSKGCGPIVHTLMKEAMKRVSPQQKPTDFAHPKGWLQQAICPLAGLPASKACPGTTDEWFPPGHLHKHKTCPFHKRLTIDTRNGLLATAACPSTVLQDKLFVVVPSQYDQWASAVGLSTPPHHKSPLCQRASNAPKDFSLTIREPIDRARYMIDPTIPTQYATIALQAESNHRPKEIIWHRNGKPIGRSSWPYRFRWTMVRGKHHFHATSTDGRIQSQVVQITVY
jgi:penicillin-binding protein 1C